MNKDLMGAGFVLIAAGVYAVFLYTSRRAGSAKYFVPQSSPPVGGASKLQLPDYVTAPKKETAAERFNRIKNNVREQMRAIGMKPPGGEIPDLPTGRAPHKPGTRLKIDWSGYR